MYLLFCTHCFEVYNLDYSPKDCTCGKTGGHYIEDGKAMFYGPAVPLRFDNRFINAVEWASKAIPGEYSFVAYAEHEDEKCRKVTKEAYLELEER